MEVHAHTHTPRKKWTHYFWEFMMLFLAVFCGFLAENQREHIVEHQREKVLMKSMVKDLEADTAFFSKMIWGITQFNSHIDSLIPLLTNTNDLDSRVKEIYSQQVWMNLYYKAIYTDRTIEQLKNSGNFRLIRKTVVSDGIIAYDGYVKNFVISMQDEALLAQWRKVDDCSAGIFRSVVFRNWMKNGINNSPVELPLPPYFLSADKKQIDEYVNQLDKYAVFNSWFIDNVHKAIKQAASLNSLIKKEYHLE